MRIINQGIASALSSGLILTSIAVINLIKVKIMGLTFTDYIVNITFEPVNDWQS